jgi:DNA polymerase III alpha subunit (gram-positive type)
VSILIGDLETDGFKPDNIWVVGVLDYDTGKFDSYTGENIAEGLLRLAEADLVIGHNFIGYDMEVAEKLTGGLVKFDRDRIVDTLVLGRKLLPEMKSQKLEVWGEMLGLPKIQFNEGFERFTPTMVPYCQRDCEVTKMVFDFLMEIQG